MGDFLEINIEEDIIRFKTLINKGIKILLVEGNTDVKVFNELKSLNNSLRVIECEGKENLLTLLSVPDLKDHPNILAFVDKDFDDIFEYSQCRQLNIDNLLFSEYSSLEYYLVKSEGFKRWVNEITSKKISSETFSEELVCSACNLIRYLTYVRYYNSIKKGDIIFNEFIGLKRKNKNGKPNYDLTNRYKAINNFIKFEKDDFFACLQSINNYINSKLHMCSTMIEKESLKSYIDLLDGNNVHIAAQGHDLLSVIVIILNKYSDDFIQLNDPTLESIVLSHFNIEEFKKYNSTNSILNWVCS